MKTHVELDSDEPAERIVHRSRTPRARLIYHVSAAGAVVFATTVSLSGAQLARYIKRFRIHPALAVI